ncbi:hypothetical protein [Bradyrhizobium sp.]|uniref:hypothetical protein n=1 Tax=Bradyrhizobium sp. TaxID=376 RepID=UPI002622CA0A|nr:hypothetical protein [Bradyrhizobium sp.]
MPTYRQYVSPNHVAIASALAGQHNEAASAIEQQLIILRPLLGYKSPALAGAPAARNGP